MNPRVVLLLAIAALFVTAWSMDAKYQSAVILSRKNRPQPAVAAASTEIRDDLALLAFETSDVTSADALTPAAVESAIDVSEQPEMGWECFPGCRDGSSQPATSDDQPAPVQAVLVSEITGAGEDATMLHDDIPMNNLWMFGAIDVPLPRDIAAGEYRIVSDRGDIRTLTLTAPDLAYHAQSKNSTPRDLYTVDANGARWYFVRVKPEVTSTDTAKTPIDWKPIAESIRAWIGNDAQLTVWRWTCKYDRLKRRMNALSRQSQKYGEAMTQALWHAVKMMESAKRISSEEAAEPRF